MNNLSLRRIEGGFAIDDETAERMGISLADLKEIADRIEVRGKPAISHSHPYPLPPAGEGN